MGILALLIVYMLPPLFAAEAPIPVPADLDVVVKVDSSEYPAVSGGVIVKPEGAYGVKILPYTEVHLKSRQIVVFSKIRDVSMSMQTSVQVVEGKPPRVVAGGMELVLYRLINRDGAAVPLRLDIEADENMLAAIWVVGALTADFRWTRTGEEE